MNASPSSLTASSWPWGLGLLVRPYVRCSDGLIWATAGLDFLSEDYVLLNWSINNTMLWSFKRAGYSAFGLASLRLSCVMWQLLSSKQINWNFVNESKPIHLGPLKLRLIQQTVREPSIYYWSRTNSKIELSRLLQSLVHWIKS